MKLLRTPDQAAAILLKGGVGVLPTDTIYGLVACAVDKKAVERFYLLKHREHKPGTVVAANIDQLVDLGVPKRYLRTVEYLWPNPISVEIGLGNRLNYLHMDTGRQGFRIVADEYLRLVLNQTGPLVTSSANKPGEPGSTNVDQAYRYFLESVDFYVDGGDLSDRMPSTIIRIVDDAIEVIRKGAVDIDENGQIHRRE